MFTVGALTHAGAWRPSRRTAPIAYGRALIASSPPMPNGTTSGPMIIAVLNVAWLRPTALTKSGPETRLGRIACRAGISTAKVIKLTTLRAMTYQMLTDPASVSPARPAAAARPAVRV